MSDSAEAANGEFWADADGERALQRYRTIVQAIDDGIFQLDAEGRMIAVNDALLEMTGYSRDDLLGEHVSLVMDGEDCRRIERNVAGETDGQHSETFETTIHTVSGGTVPCELQVDPLVGDGESGGTVGIVRDISERESTEGVAERRELERELRERERRLSSLIDNVPGMVYRCRNERGWPMEFVSDACEEVTGYAAEALERGDVEWGDDVMVQDDREMLWETVQREATEGETFSETYRIETADGETRWVRDRGRGIFDDGDLVEIEGIISDVTERKRAEQRLKEERDMFADGPAVVFRWEPDEEAGWPVEYVSRNVEDVLGYTPEELESGEVPYADLLFDEELDRIASEVERNSDGTTEQFSHDPYRVRTKDGEVRWVKDTTKISRDESGEITNYLGYLVDITERKERERELTQYEAIVETVNDGVYVVEEDGRFTMVNEAYVEMTGYDRDELLGEHVSLVVDEDTIEQAQRAEAAMRQDAADSPTIEAELQTADGERLPSEATFALLPGPEGREHRVGIARDISDRKERERELRRKERRYEAIFEDPNILVGLLEPDGTVLDINRTAMEYIEADLAAVTGEPFWETPWWGEGDGVQDSVREWTERAANGEYVDFEVDLTRPDGERYTLSGYFRPVVDDDGEVVSIIVSDRDVTERKRNERELEESERRYRTLVENFPNGAVALVDEDIRYRTVGGSPTDTGDVTTEEAEGAPVAEVVPPELAEDLVPAYEAAFEGETTTFEAESKGRIYRFHVVPVRDDDGEVFAALGMSQDVTEREEAKRELERSERRYRTLVENFPNGAVGLFDEDLRYQVAGGQGLEEVGTDREEIVGKTLWDRYPDDVAERLEPKFRAALAGETREFEWEFHDRYWHACTIPIRDESGDVFAGMITVQDITERKERERELERNKEELETLFEVLPVGVVVAEKGGEIVEANDTAHEIWGGDVFDAASVEEYEQYPVRRIDSGEPVAPEGMTLARVLDGEQVTEPDVFEIDTVDGERRIVELEGMPIRDDAGEVVRGVITLSDITERWEAQRNLAESERRYRTLVENFPNGAVGLFDEDLKYIAVGGELLDRLGVDPEDRIGRSIREILSPDLLEGIEPYFEAALAGETNSFELEFHGRHLHAHALPVRNADDEVFAGMLVVQDVTERREYERKLEASNERLEQFAYAASHDLQEPLRMVSSYLQLLDRRYGDELDADGREFLEFAVDGADRMREMIDGLLEYSRVETRGDPFERVDLDAVLDDVLDDLKLQIEESDAEVTAESLPTVEGDASQLRQVFQNLLDNAIEYSGEEPPEITVAAERNGEEWLVSVADEGIGIDPADQERVFEVFQRLHTQSEHAGTGIGLALCRRIVERHGGEIWVESEPGEGATFSFTLPVADGDDPDQS